MSRVQLGHRFEEIIALENLLAAWREFSKGKRGRKDVQEFESRLMEHLIGLHYDLAAKRYRHGPYEAFRISDPKPRQIHKARVRDRVLHHAVYRILYPFFDRTFISDSYSCRAGKGTHAALRRFESFGRKVSRNGTRSCWVLKGDARKFFASIDQEVLRGILSVYIPDRDILWLLERIIGSFDSGVAGRGLPLGNLTSQLLVNIYMNEFDQYVKHRLSAKYYMRYADDFVVLSDNREWLKALIGRIEYFLGEALGLQLHPDKVFIKSLASGVDWLGWVHWPDHRIVRATTRRRMMKRVTTTTKDETRQSYVGLLSHGNAWGLREEIKVLETPPILPLK